MLIYLCLKSFLFHTLFVDIQGKFAEAMTKLNPFRSGNKVRRRRNRLQFAQVAPVPKGIVLLIWEGVQFSVAVWQSLMTEPPGTRAVSWLILTWIKLNLASSIRSTAFTLLFLVKMAAVKKVFWFFNIHEQISHISFFHKLNLIYFLQQEKQSNSDEEDTPASSEKPSGNKQVLWYSFVLVLFPYICPCGCVFK